MIAYAEAIQELRYFKEAYLKLEAREESRRALGRKRRPRRARGQDEIAAIAEEAQATSHAATARRLGMSPSYVSALVQKAECDARRRAYLAEESARSKEAFATFSFGLRSERSLAEPKGHLAELADGWMPEWAVMK